MMEITVVLYATLTKHHPEGKGNQPFAVELPEGSRIEDLLDHLGVDKDEAKQAFIRHKKRPWDYPLKDGERVALFPPVAGG